MKLYHGQRVVNIYTNNETNNKKKEMAIMEKIQSFKPPKVILSIKTWAEEFVDAHYKKPHPKKLTTQTKQEPLQFIPPAPPCINLSSEEEK